MEFHFYFSIPSQGNNQRKSLRLPQFSLTDLLLNLKSFLIQNFEWECQYIRGIKDENKMFVAI